MVEFATSKGEVKYMVNAAGVSPSQAPVKHILQVDLYGTSVLMEEFGKVIAEGGSGIIISSQSGHRLPALPQEQNGAPIVDAWRNKQGRKVEYKASVEDGSTIKFDASGRWIEMKSYGGVPTKMLPQALLNHIDKYYEGQQIVWVTKTPKRYQVQLTDGSKLEFNAKGVFQAFL